MRFGQFYYCYDGDFEIHKLLWGDEISDFCNLRLGFVFNTYKEALLARPLLYKALMGERMDIFKYDEFSYYADSEEV